MEWEADASRRTFLKILNNRMGHSRTSTTLDIYARAFEKQEQAVPDVLEESLNIDRQRMNRKAKKM